MNFIPSESERECLSSGMAGHVAGETFCPPALPIGRNMIYEYTSTLQLPRPPPHPLTTDPLPTGGWRRRSLAVADRDLLPQQAHAEGRQEPAGRLRRPLPGVRAGAFAERRGGVWISASLVGKRRQHLRRIRRRTVRRCNWMRLICRCCGC